MLLFVDWSSCHRIAAIFGGPGPGPGSPEEAEGEEVHDDGGEEISERSTDFFD